MTKQNKTIIQVAYTLQGSPSDGFHIERTESAALSIYQRLACLFSEVRTLHRAIVSAEINTGKATAERAELDASAVILSLVARTLEHRGDGALEIEDHEDRDERDPLMH